MNRNESSLDRAGRVAIGVALLFLFFVGPKTPWGLVGVVPLMTGLLGWCPIYQFLGVSTCAASKSAKGS